MCHPACYSGSQITSDWGPLYSDHFDPAGVPALQDAIRHLEGCEATWVESAPAHETHDGQTVWDPEVRVCDLAKYLKAKRA